tara:strand:- start:4043 stop:4369 length:327 start_codon:yes stop_codon:yes gene_type:complete
MVGNKSMKLKLRKMRELRRFFLKKSKKNLGKSKSNYRKKEKQSKKKRKKEKKHKYTKKQIKKIFLSKANKKFKKTQKGGSVNFQPLTDIARSGLNEVHNVKNTFFGHP